MPLQNACIESLHRHLRNKRWSLHQFASLAEAKAIIEAWPMDCNHHRPHSSLRHLTPSEFVAQRQDQLIVEEVIYSG